MSHLGRLIRDHQPCVALTGAGISTESGIPDFRSAGGIWTQFDPLEVASIDGFWADPERVWEFYGLRLEVLRAARPNPAHLALAELEQAGDHGAARIVRSRPDLVDIHHPRIRVVEH